MPSNNLILCCPFSSCPQSFPASGSFLVSQPFATGGQSIGASTSVLPVNIQGWFPLGLTGLISAVQGTLKSLLQHHYSKASILQRSAFIMVQLLNLYLATGKSMALTIRAFVGKVISRLFHTLSRFVIAFLPRSQCLLLPWLQSPSTVILELKKIKSVTVSIFPHLFAMKSWDYLSWSLFFECWVLSHFFSLLFHFHHETL